MTWNRLILRGLRHHWRAHLAVLFGMIVGTGVLSGALLVGDSVRGSLRDITLERLGEIDFALSGPNYFSESMAERLRETPDFERYFDAVAPAVLIQASMEVRGDGGFSRDVSLLGVDQEFWNLQVRTDDRGDLSTPTLDGSNDEIWINAALARELDAGPGDEIVLRFQKPDPIPAEAVHGRKTGAIQTLRLNIGGVLEDRGFGRFGLRPNQQLPRNAFLPLGVLQHHLGDPSKINTLFVSRSANETGSGFIPLKDLHRRILLAASLEDLGLRLVSHESKGYLSLESLRMVLRQTDAAAVTEAAEEIGFRIEPTLTYLANTIEVGEASIPYSTVAALNPTTEPPLGPLFLLDGSPAPALESGEIYLNRWAAEQLSAVPGDDVRLTYYLSGSTGEFEEDGASMFRLRGVVRMEGLGGDADLTPQYPGIHDAQSIRDWDPPFPIDLSRIQERDEHYWETYKALPKAFIPLSDATDLWTSRFGQYTSLRLAPGESISLAEAGQRFTENLHRHINPEFAGLIFAPVKELGLEASRGASDFGLLFLGFSFFIIVSAMLLVRLTFVLGIERRVKEIGLYSAVGFSPRQIRRLFMLEGGLLALTGGILGCAGGVAFASLMLYGLRTWWRDSVGTSFLFLHLEPSTLGLGAFVGTTVGLLSIYLAVRRLARADPLRLVQGGGISGGTRRTAVAESISRRREERVAVLAGALGVGCLAASGAVSAGTQAALFYVAGAAVMMACLFFFSSRFRSVGRPESLTRQTFPAIRLGLRNAASYRGRSLLTIGLMSSATFVIVTVGAMRKEGGHASYEPESPTGGFEYLAQSNSPLLYDLDDPEGQFDLGLQSDTIQRVREAEIFGFRLNPGEEASCLNLYRPSQPRILGVPDEFIERGGFSFQGAMDRAGEVPENPWALLQEELHDGAVPVIGDYNTVLWILHSGLGKDLEVRDGADRPVKLRFVALLKGSALQGEVLIAERQFMRLYPDRSGKEFFLIDTPEEGDQKEIRTLLERDLRAFGFDVSSTAERLESYHAVENTYLSTFQALGGLGLLLGTLGLTAVVLRGILERRGELALMACVGYSRRSLTMLVLAENLLLLFAGLGVGLTAALVATAPTLWQAGAFPHAGSLWLTLVAILATGMLSGLAGVRALYRLPILESLRAP